MIENRDIPHREAFEKFKVSHVRFLAESRTDEVGPAARAWLSELRDNREEEAASRRDAREERTLAISERALSISKEANRIASGDLAEARKQARWAKWAAIIATVAAITAARESIIETISLLMK
ncbi:hypothetical protein [Desulforhopalus sp. IMCC35007]|uniref:hypothetical protein n=1 Tax=Desulforhopalus sp. IMCC35007 TaxID=2569543 RepID=UPI0010AEC19C|nr:hypothetical protein [Desulforhopalus sp. IMCC35007]TKB07030.1 hypothetical protein FCL48_18680 [Desulforhopalus sp. IMCC35007]